MKKIIALIAICACVFSGCKNEMPTTRIGGEKQTSVNSNFTETDEKPLPVTKETTEEIATTVKEITTTSPNVDIISDTETDFATPEHLTAPQYDGEILEIKEKMFVAQSNDIWYNAPDYMDKIIKYEGLFDIYTDPDTGIDYYSVIRYGPGCCGIDSNCGFEVAWVDGEEHQYPKLNDWCEVMGKLEIYDDGGISYLRINLISLTVLEERGKETVTQ